MAIGFPPQPVYPNGIDSDYTLFLEYNTTESVLAADNEPWSDEILIRPVPPDQNEVWPDNGFCTIEGELVYYDVVEKNTYGKVCKLKRCARNLGGKKTKYNRAGTWVRGFVVAEHHNQLVQSIVNMENFIGINFDDRVETLDYRIRNLHETPVIFDDFSCPDITFLFQIIENNPASGILASYRIEIDGSFNSFRLDFGDGEFTTTDQEGTHRYSLNSLIDPVVTVTNNKCQIIQTPITRDNPTEPQAVMDPPIFDVPIPEIIDIPPIVVPSIEQPPVEIDLPPILFPCIDIAPFPGISIDIGPIDIQVPSVISFTPVDIPSVISITPVEIPSVIEIEGVSVNFPSIIEFGPVPSFSPIGFGPAPSFSPIEFGPAPSIAPIDVDVTVTVDMSDIPSCIPLCDAPSSIAVDWGAPPMLNVAFVQGVSTQSAKRRQKSQEEMELMRELGEDFQEFFDGGDDSDFQVEYSSIGIPHEITIVPPEFPDIRLTHDVPNEIKLVVPEIPDVRMIVAEDAKVPLVYEGPPIEVKINTDEIKPIQLISDIPSVVKLEGSLPNKIELVGVEKIPETIEVKGIPDFIQVKGIPDSIELKAPESIKLVLDENVEVPLVYKGAPIEMKIEMPKEWTQSDVEGENQCVMIIPCGAR